MRRSPKRNKSDPQTINARGFVLLEIIVSAAILSVGCVALIQALTTCMRTASLAQDQYAAALAIEDSLWKMDRAGGVFSADDARAPDGFRDPSWSAEDQAPSSVNLQSILRQQAVTLRWPASSLTISAYYVIYDTAPL